VQKRDQDSAFVDIVDYISWINNVYFPACDDYEFDCIDCIIV